MAPTSREFSPTLDQPIALILLLSRGAPRAPRPRPSTPAPVWPIGSPFSTGPGSPLALPPCPVPTALPASLASLTHVRPSRQAWHGLRQGARFSADFLALCRIPGLAAAQAGSCSRRPSPLSRADLRLKLASGRWVAGSISLGRGGRRREGPQSLFASAQICV
jgi:hypothetical protein